MRDVAVKSLLASSGGAGGGSKTRLMAVVVAAAVVATQVYVGIRLSSKYRSNSSNGITNNAAKKSALPLRPGGHVRSDVFSEDASRQVEAAEAEAEAAARLRETPGTVAHLVAHLPRPELDEVDFRAEVARPLKELVDKFKGGRAEAAVRKVLINVDKEEQKMNELREEIAKVRKVLGVGEQEEEDQEGAGDGPDKEKVEEGDAFKSRKLRSLPKCPARSPLLLGSLLVRQTLPGPEPEPGTRGFADWYGAVGSGGSYSPADCEARRRVAVVVPYRDRERHLSLLLHHLHPFLQRQQAEYQVNVQACRTLAYAENVVEMLIFVVEQAGQDDFNRAALMNVGFLEATQRRPDLDCFVFHDVDLVPEDDRNLYECPADTPKHLAVAVNKWKYRLLYERYFGGVTALSKKQFRAVDGFANSFYGWGGEDDDLHHRVTSKGYNITRQPGNVARFSMLKHDYVKTNTDLAEMMGKSASNALDSDGISTLKYKIEDEEGRPLYTWLKARLPPAPARRKPNMWEQARGKLWSGMSGLAGGFGEAVAKKAQEFAAAREEKEEAQRDHVY